MPGGWRCSRTPRGPCSPSGSRAGSIGAELVNDPGSLTMNQLNAADVDAARGFYSSLFGWRIETASEDPPYWGIHNGDVAERRA